MIRHAKSMSLVLTLAVVLCIWGPVRADGATLAINELMASNSTTETDPQGDYDDWIELVNLSDTSIDVGGMYLTDDPERPTQWPFPAGTTIAPGEYLLVWADKDVDDAGLHANFALSAGGEDVVLFDVDGVTQLDGVHFDEQPVDVSYGRHPDGTGEWAPTTVPTPGSANVRFYDGFVAKPTFSPGHGFYSGSVSVTLACETPGAIIYYTTDGTCPYYTDDRVGANPTARLYTEPIRITETTYLRAMAVLEEWKPSSIETQTYLFVADVIEQSPQHERPGTEWPSPGSVNGQTIDYGMDPDVVDDPEYVALMDEALLAIPSLSLVTDLDNLFDSSRGIYVNASREGSDWERPVSAELICPNGDEGFQIDAGLRIRGGFSRSSSNPKHSFRLFFRSEYGVSKLRYPLFGDEGVDAFDNLDLRTAQNYAWSMESSNAGEKNTFVREVFCRDLQRETDKPYTRSRFYHLYINGQYWGLYQSQERSEASYAESYFGGDSADYDVIKTDSYQTSYTDGTMDLWHDLWALCDEGFATDAQYYAVQGKRPDGTDDPTLPVHVDVENLIDYMLGIFFTGNDDAPVTLSGNQANNFFAIRNRQTDARQGWQFFAYDCEHSLGARTGLYDDRTATVSAGSSRSHFNPQWLHQKLMQHDEYKIQFGDRAHRYFFNDGVMTTEGAVALWWSRVQEIDLAIIAESARWGDQRSNRTNNPYTKADWWEEVYDYMIATYFPARPQIVLNQLRNRGLYPSVAAPVFYVNNAYQHGGVIASSDNLSMTASGGTIWYTLDGSDPRVAGTSATAGDSLTLVTEDAAKRVLVPSGPIDDAWRSEADFDDSAWLAGTGGIGYERSTGYEPYFDIDLTDAMYGVNTGCYIRIPFTVSEGDYSDIAGLKLSVRYDDGFVAYLNGVEIQRVLFDGEPAWNSAAQENHSDIDAIDLENFDVSGSVTALRSGQNLLAIHALNVSASSSDFLISVELSGSEGAAGGTPAGVNPAALRYSDAVTLAASAPVKARTYTNGVWSALNEAVFGVGPVAESLRISEIMYHPAGDPNAEFIELTNIGSETINLNRVELTDGVDFVFGDVTLAPHDHLLVVRDVAAFEARYGQGYAIAGQYAGSLDNAGEEIELIDAIGQTIGAFDYQDDWYSLTDGQGFSLVVRDPVATDPDAWDDKGAWRPSAATGGSPGFDDAGDVPELGAVVINELLANPATDSDWIELYNTTGQAIDLDGWFLSDDANDLGRYEIAAGTVVAAGGYVVFSEAEHFGNPDDPGCHTPFALSRNGETLYLHSGSNGTLTGYSEQEKFDASEAGVSLGRYRKSTGSYNFVALDGPTPGGFNAGPAIGPIVISEIMYHPADYADIEYVELLNISDSDVTFYDEVRRSPWRFTDDPDDPGIDLLFPTDDVVVLEPGQCLVLTADESAFVTAYGTKAGVRVLEWGSGQLSNAGDKVQISKPGDTDGDDRVWIRVDRVVYSDGAHGDDFAQGFDPWPSEADGGGLSLTRIDPADYGNDPANWEIAAPSPGAM